MPASGDAANEIRTAALPNEWVRTLQALAPITGTLVTVATNPKEWLDTFVRTIVAEWFVGGIIDAGAYGLGWLIFAYERTTSILLDAVPVLESPYLMAEDVAVGGIETIFGAARTIAEAAGLAGPPALLFATLLLVTVVLATGYAVWRLIPGSDAIEGGIEVFTK